MELSYLKCDFCPRHCMADRTIKTGFCKAPGEIIAAKAMIHQGEEPCLIGEHGAGAVFFSHCNLRCVFCQNEDISLGGKGIAITEDRLKEIILKFQEEGAACIDLVTPTPYLASVVKVLKEVKPKLTIPVVYNCGGYESAEALKHLEGLVDVYLPDLKYHSHVLSMKYSMATDYFERAAEALQEMVRQVGAVRFDEKGIMVKGVLVRHLVLPFAWHDSEDLMDALGKMFPKGTIYVSLLSQYTPFGLVKQGQFPELDRRVTTYEYQHVVDRAIANGLNGYTQLKEAATMEMKPEFDFSGL